MMAKETPKTTPDIAKLPLGAGEDQPVIIDLPDGQKLVVGNLAHGSVIEVATWRGTGRPDSRTSRLMLGMSSGAAAEQAASESKKSIKKSDDEKPSLIDLVIVASKKVFALISKLQAKTKKSNSKKVQNSASNVPESSSESSSKPIVALLPKSEPIRSDSDLDMDEWLNNLIKKSEAKAAKSSAKSTANSTAKKTTPKTAASKNNVRKAAPKQSGRR